MRMRTSPHFPPLLRLGGVSADAQIFSTPSFLRAHVLICSCAGASRTANGFCFFNQPPRVRMRYLVAGRSPSLREEEPLSCSGACVVPRDRCVGGAARAHGAFPDARAFLCACAPRPLVAAARAQWSRRLSGAREQPGPPRVSVMYQRSRAVAGRLGPAARCWGPRCRWGGARWGQSESSRCGYRARQQDLVSCCEKAPQALGPPMALKFHLSLVEQQVEAARTFLLPPPGADLVGGTFPSASEQKLSLHELLQGLEQGLPCRPAALSPLEGMEASVTTVDGQREDDITVREGTGLDSASLDSLYSLFYGKPCWMPCQALAPFQATAGTANSAPSGSPGNHDPSMEEHLAVMYEKLQHELPNFFLKVPDYGIYSQDVEFVNEILHLRTRGRAMYQLALTLCRLVAWNYFANMRLEVLKLTQHPENWSIQARWRITGLPFHVLMLRFYKRDKRELYRTYDAYSTFFLDSRGLIRCHQIDKLMPSQPPVAKVKKLLVAALVGLGLLEHRPSLQLLLSALAGKQQGAPAGYRDS
ncbi:unnamed protein product [Natator depressus]